MNKIGFNVLVWTAVVSDDLMPITDRLKKIGYDGVECLIGSEDERAYKRFGDHAKALGLEVTSVFVIGKDENPVSTSSAIRSKAVDRIKWAIDRAHDMNCRIIAGPFHSAHGMFSREAPQEQEYGWSAEVLRAAGDYAVQAKVTFALEAVNRFECYMCNTMDQLKKLVDAVNHPNVKAMYDTHHSNIEDKSIAEAINTIAPVLHHVHISENDRGTPGDGHVNFDDAFSALSKIGYKGWLTIEAFSRNDIDFANAINVWREFSPPWDIAEKGLKFIQEMCVKHGLDKN